MEIKMDRLPRVVLMRPQIQDQEVVVVAEITVRCTAVRAAQEL